MTPVTQKPRVNPDPCHTLWATMWSQLCWCGHATGRCCVSCHCHPAACCTAMTALPPVMSQGAATCRVITVVLLPMGHCMVTVAAAWSCHRALLCVIPQGAAAHRVAATMLLHVSPWHTGAHCAAIMFAAHHAMAFISKVSCLL